MKTSTAILAALVLSAGAATAHAGAPHTAPAIPSPPGGFGGQPHPMPPPPPPPPGGLGGQPHPMPPNPLPAPAVPHPSPVPRPVLPILPHLSLAIDGHHGAAVSFCFPSACKP